MKYAQHTIVIITQRICIQVVFIFHFVPRTIASPKFAWRRKKCEKMEKMRRKEELAAKWRDWRWACFFSSVQLSSILDSNTGNTLQERHRLEPQCYYQGNRLASKQTLDSMQRDSNPMLLISRQGSRKWAHRKSFRLLTIWVAFAKSHWCCTNTTKLVYRCTVYVDKDFWYQTRLRLFHGALTPQLLHGFTKLLIFTFCQIKTQK